MGGGGLGTYSRLFAGFGYFYWLAVYYIMFCAFVCLVILLLVGRPCSRMCMCSFEVGCLWIERDGWVNGFKDMDRYMDEWMMLCRTCGLNLGGRNGRMGGGGWMVRSGMVGGRNGLLGDLWYIVVLLLILLLVLLFRCVLLGRVSCWGRVSCELCAVR